ncbi:DNA-binding transcriptional regulator YhcF (GntR family) [Sphingobacterium alimentarium]|jgi:GntR family transcriptional regulator|uniref:DNA-binding transcriptional regulator YhcF (GntR family) n=1 Tax=Sphingobacterium alimentarium TaxID=797292 RepID=A0A4R3W0Z6_9SPHI|nr:GntR family transcriptional regulator [Sphingobacterium alimentarium]TCV20017.1 DNA-binding transcriptional regulator YhcF (GntR family) [Sphingobacterium alimentarium]
MDFNPNKAIYLQIVDHICEQILLNTWSVETKIPSVREMAVELGVNPNTVMRTYDFLQQHNIITNKRGVGFFVTADSLSEIKKYKKEVFMKEDLPQVFKNIYLLDISLEELKDKYQSFIVDNYKSN